MKVKIKKYTREQLSRILGEHDCGQLAIGGCDRWGYYNQDPYKKPVACVNQVAYN